MRKDTNNQSHWNTKWLQEGKDTWRQYPKVIAKTLEIIKPDNKLIDLGCGNGVFLNKVKQKFPNMWVFGLDISSVAIQQLKEFYGIDGIVSKLPEIPYPIVDNQFDYVIMLEVVEHIEEEKGLMFNAFRILKPGGKVIIAVPYDHTPNYKEFIKNQSSEHLHWYDDLKVLQVLSYYGKNPTVEVIEDTNIKDGVEYPSKYYLGVAEK
jgi:ubiquinone/menaquinone biosynthesis C-methylase UbiE